MFGFGVGRLDFIVFLTSALDVWLWGLFVSRWHFCVWSFAVGFLVVDFWRWSFGVCLLELRFLFLALCV